MKDFDVFVGKSGRKKKKSVQISSERADFSLQIPLKQIKSDRSRKINADGPREKIFDCRSSDS